MLTTYLVVTGTSGWEMDWQKYRGKRYPGYLLYSIPQNIIFAILLLFATGFPFILKYLYKLKFEHTIEMTVWEIVFVGIGIIGYPIMILVGYYLKYFHKPSMEDKIEEHWENLKKEPNTIQYLNMKA